MKAFEQAKVQLKAPQIMQLCYDGRVVNKSDRYIFLGQFMVEELKKTEALIAVKSFHTGNICNN